MLGPSGFQGAGGLFYKASMLCAMRMPSRKARLPVSNEQVCGGRNVHVVVGTPWTATAQKTAVVASKSKATSAKVVSTTKPSPEALEAAYNELWYGVKGEYQPGHLVVRQADSTEGLTVTSSSSSSSSTADIIGDSNESQALNVAQGFSTAAEQPEQPAAQATNAVTVWGTTAAAVTAAAGAAGAACDSIEDQSDCADSSSGDSASEQGSDGIDTLESAATLALAAATAAAAAAASLPQSLQELAAPAAPTAAAAAAAVALMMMRHRIAAAVVAASRQCKTHTAAAPSSTEAAALETPLTPKTLLAKTPLRAKLLPPLATTVKTASRPASSGIKGCSSSLHRIKVGSSGRIKIGSSLRGRAAMPRVKQLGGPVRPAAATMRHSLCPVNSSSSSSMNPILGVMRAKMGTYSSSNSSTNGSTGFLSSSSSSMVGYNSYVAVRMKYSARLMAQTNRTGYNSSSNSGVSSTAAESPVSPAAASAALLPAATTAAAAAPEAASSHNRGAALLSSSVGALLSSSRCSSSSGGGSNDTAPVSDRLPAPKPRSTVSSSSSSKVRKMVQQFNTAATSGGSSSSDGSVIGGWGYLQLCHIRNVRLASQCSITAGAAAAHKAAEGASLAVTVV